MSEQCEAEMCPFWTGQGCACDFLDYDAEDRRRARREMGVYEEEDGDV